MPDVLPGTPDPSTEGGDPHRRQLGDVSNGEPCRQRSTTGPPRRYGLSFDGCRQTPDIPLVLPPARQTAPRWTATSDARAKTARSHYRILGNGTPVPP